MALAKIRINGEYHEYDPSLNPLHEALLVEKTLKVKYDQWRADLTAGNSSTALAMFILLILRRAGKDVSWADIESGAYTVDMNDFDVEGAPEPDPTIPAPPTEATSSTGGAT